MADQNATRRELLYLYQLFLVVRKQLLMQGNGSVFTNLKTDILREHYLVVPTSSVLKAFDNLMISLHERLKLLAADQAALALLRDALLPKLLSGQIRIPDAEKLVAGAV